MARNFGDLYINEDGNRTFYFGGPIIEGEELIEKIIQGIQGKIKALEQFYVEEPDKGYHRLAKQNVNYCYGIVYQRYLELDKALKEFKQAVHDLPVYKPATD